MLVGEHNGLRRYLNFDVARHFAITGTQCHEKLCPGVSSSSLCQRRTSIERLPSVVGPLAGPFRPLP